MGAKLREQTQSAPHFRRVGAFCVCSRDLFRYSNAELSVLAKMLGDFLAAEKVGVRIVPGTE